MLYGFSVAKEGGESRYSPPFRRQGSSATFVFEVLGVYNSPSLTITLQAKDVEDTACSDTATTRSVFALASRKLRSSGPVLRHTRHG